jgi:hypothetical protein
MSMRTSTIRYFDKDTEELIGEIRLPNVPLAKLRELFHAEMDDPMYGSFPIGNEQANFFNHLLGSELEISRYDHFLDPN